MWPALYRLFFYPFFSLLTRIVALGSRKVRKGVYARKHWREVMVNIPQKPEGQFRVHIHVASTGEFEQAKPLIRLLRDEYPEKSITISFFSPSGYESQRDYTSVDGICYLPEDRAPEMAEFLNLLKPDVIVAVRYDLWYEFIRQASLSKIPVVLICGVLRGDSLRFFLPIRGFFKSTYGRLGYISCVEEADRNAFAKLVPEVPLSVEGDTRYDRVVQRIADSKAIVEKTAIRRVAESRHVVVAGSTWPADEKLFNWVEHNSDILFVVAPHEPTDEHVENLLQRFSNSVRLSMLLQGKEHDASIDCVVVDSVGILADLYEVGDVAYVGGGFGEGVHSLLEPAAWGVPLLSGPRIERSRDASAMSKGGVLDVVNGEEQCKNVITELFRDDGVRRDRGKMSAHFVRNRLGASQSILRSLQEKNLI